MQIADAYSGHWPETEAARAASNNKAVCLLALGRVDEAINILEPLRNDEELRLYAIPNLARCYAKKHLEDKAQQAIDDLLSLTGDTEQIANLRSEIAGFMEASE